MTSPRLETARRATPPVGSRRLLCLLIALLAGLTVSCADNNGDPFNQNVVTRLPIVVSDPTNGAINVDLRKALTISFPQDVDTTTLKDENLILQEDSKTAAQTRLVERTSLYTAARREVTIFPRNPLKPNTSYQIVVQGVKTPGQVLFASTTITFATGNATQPPTVRGQLRDPLNRVRPLADAANVDPRSLVELVFSRSMEASSVTSAFAISPRIVGTFALDTNNTRLVFEHATNPFPLGQAFVVMVGADATDSSPERVRLGSNFVARFSTPNIGQFTVVATEPQQQTPAVAAQADTPVRLTFGEPVDITSARQSIVFAPASAAPQLTFANNDQVVLINHANLPAGTAVTVTVSKDLASALGVTLGQANGGRDFVLNYVIESNPPKLATVNPTIPANDARGVSPTTNITFNFDEKLDATTVNGTTFTVSRNSLPITGTVALSLSGQSVVFTPSTTLRADPNPIVATATTGIRDLAGTAIATNISISFFIDSTPPTLVFADPTNGSTEIAVDRFNTQPIVVDFSKAVDQAATRRGFSIAPSRATTRTGANGLIVFGSATRLLYTTQAFLLGNTQYTVRISTQDLAGNPTPTPLTFAFTTDATPPQVNTGLLQPAPGAIGQSRQPPVLIEFTERMDIASVTRAFSLTSQGARFGTTSGRLTFGEVGSTPRRTTVSYALNPGVFLPPNAIVNINLTAQATDLGLTPLPAAFLSTFSTGP